MRMWDLSIGKIPIFYVREHVLRCHLAKVKYLRRKCTQSDSTPCSGHMLVKPDHLTCFCFRCSFSSSPGCHLLNLQENSIIDLLSSNFPSEPQEFATLRLFSPDRCWLSGWWTVTPSSTPGSLWPSGAPYWLLVRSFKISLETLIGKIQFRIKASLLSANGSFFPFIFGIGSCLTALAAGSTAKC